MFPRVLLESTVSLGSHSLFIVVTISRKCCQATAFHDRRNCTKGCHDVENLRSHLLLRANQSQAWQTHTGCLTNVLDVKAAYAGSHHPFTTLLFKTKYYFNSGRCQGFKSVELCLRWRGNLSAHMPRILHRPIVPLGHSFLSWSNGQREGKNKQTKKANVENQRYPTRTIIIIPMKIISETYCRSQQWGLFCETICESNLTHHANTRDHAKCVWRHLNRVATVKSRHLLPCFRPWNVCTQCSTVLKANKVNLD